MSVYKNHINAAIGQFDIKRSNKAYNLAKMEEMADKARIEFSAEIIVFPECSLTGYCFDNLEEVRSESEEALGPSVRAVSGISLNKKIGIVFGMLQKSGDRFYNVSVFCFPDGRILYYRKTHLPVLGADRFVEHGDQLGVFDTEYGRLGMIICYDLRFPEPARELALQGARLIIQPTNLPCGGEAHLDFFTRARACENRVYLISANRIGEERGYHFLGKSQIIGPSGELLAELGEEEGIACANLDLSKADYKNIVVIPGKHEMHVFEDRRPRLYGHITKQNGFAQ